VTVSDAKKIRRALSAKTERVKPARDEDRLSLGMTMFNVPMSRGRWTDGGTAKGHFVWWIGESEAGKTFAGLQMLACAANNPEFDDYDLVFIDRENGMKEIPLAKFFGRKLADRLTVIKPKQCRYVEDLYHYLFQRLKRGDKLMAVADSYDAFDTRDDKKKFEEQMSAYEAKTAKEEAGEAGGKDPKGSMGMAKAKWSKNGLKRLVDRLEETGSILFVISQVYDMVGSPVPAKTTAGGRALRFFAHEQVWTKVVEKITKKVGGDTWHQGNVVEIEVRKNRLSGWHGKVHVTFLSDSGFDEVGSNVDFLIRYGTWKKPEKSQTVRTDGFPTGDGTREKIIRQIEESPPLARKLRQLVRQTFRRVDESVTLKRKARFQ
jgi:RecA/RadA recombinase